MLDPRNLRALGEVLDDENFFGVRPGIFRPCNIRRSSKDSIWIRFFRILGGRIALEIDIQGLLLSFYMAKLNI